MNRRAFLQTVIAVPLVAVGLPRVNPPEVITAQFVLDRLHATGGYPFRVPARYRVVGGGAFGEFERGLSPDATLAWADAPARQIDEEALRRAHASFTPRKGL